MPGNRRNDTEPMPARPARRLWPGRRDALRVMFVALPVALVALLAGRLLAAWRTPRADVAVSTATLALLVVWGWALARRDARRGRHAFGGAPSPRRSALGRLRRDRLAMTGAALVAALCLGALLAPLLAPYDPSEFGDISATGYRAPSAAHWLGTDQYGRDVLSRLLFGARISLSIGFVAVAFAVGIGTLVGLAAGYLGGRADNVLMRLVDLGLAFPRLFLVLLVVGLVGPSIWLVIAVLGATGWMGTARLVRAQVLGIRGADYVRAAVALGYSTPRIVWRHVLPNAMAPVVVSATLLVGQTILTEAVLSFLGLGVQMPTPSWGVMIDEGRRVFPGVWWLSAFPGLAITLTVVGYNLLGDGLRDALDPRLRT